MKLNRYFLLLSIISILGFFPVSSAMAGTKLTAQSVMKFLNLTVGAKAAGMGDCYFSLVPDASVHFLNPAALTDIKSRSLFTDRNVWVADITQYSGALSQPIGSRIVVGLGFILMDYGEILGTEIIKTGSSGSGNIKEYISIGQVDVSQYALSASLGLAVSNQFSVGGHVKYAHSGLGSSVVELSGDSLVLNNDLNAFAFDLGTQFHTGYKGITFYMSLRNFSGEHAYPKIRQTYNLPLTFSIGITADLLRLVSTITDSHSLLLSMTGQHPIDYVEKYNFGMEYSYNNKLFLRGGYKINYGMEDWSMGLGLRKRLGNQAVSFDIAYVNTAYFNSTNRISLSWEF